MIESILYSNMKMILNKNETKEGGHWTIVKNLGSVLRTLFMQFRFKDFYKIDQFTKYIFSNHGTSEYRFMGKYWDLFQMMFAARNLNESKNQMLLDIDELNYQLIQKRILLPILSIDQNKECSNKIFLRNHSIFNIFTHGQQKR